MKPQSSRLDRFIQLQKETADSTHGVSHEIALAFVELGEILRHELDYKKDKKKSEQERLLGGLGLTKKQILFLRAPYCGICGRKFTEMKEATIDHIRPKSKGGSNDLVNLQLACPECNQMKGDRFDGVLMPSKKVMRYFLEQSNLIEDVHGKEAIDEALMAFKWLLNENELTPEVIKKCHAMLMRNRDLEDIYKGVWRPIPVFIGGQAKTEPPIVIDSLIRDWCADIKDHKSFEEIKDDHVRFETIHPFVDGNGRMGRILMNWQLIHCGQPIYVVEYDDRMKYYEWFATKGVK